MLHVMLTAIRVMLDREGTAVARDLRSVRVDVDLLAALESLARAKRIPVTFAEQVDAGLRLLVQHAEDAQTRRAAQLVAADRERSEATYRRLRGPAG